MGILMILLSLTALHALFVMAEYAFVKSNRTPSGTARSAGVVIVQQRLEEYLLLCQVTKTIVLMVMGVLIGQWLSAVSFAELTWLPAFSMTFGLTLIIPVVLALGFEVPKSLGISHADRCAHYLSWPLMISWVVLWPVLWMIGQMRQSLLRLY